MLSNSKWGSCHVNFANITVKYISRKSKYKNSQIMGRLLGFNQVKCIQIVQKNNDLANVSEKNMERAYHRLLDLGVSKSYIGQHPYLLSLPFKKIKPHYMLLEECGICPEKILKALPKFELYVGKRVSLLKAYDHLPHDSHLEKNLLKCLQMNDFQDCSSTDSDSIKSVYKRVYRLFLQHLFHLTHNEADHLIKLNVVRKWFSFRMLKCNADILANADILNKCDFKKCVRLLQLDTEYLTAALSLDKSAVVKGCAVIEDIVGKYEQIRTLGLPSHVIRTNPRILYVSSWMLEHRLSSILNCPTLSMFAFHPRFLSLISSPSRVHERLNIIQKYNIKCFTINLLFCSDAIFMKFILSGVDKMNNRDIYLFLSKELGLSNKMVQAHLRKHPYLNYVPLQTVRESLHILLETFTREEIFANIQILLYPKNKVEKIMSQMESLQHSDKGNKKELLALIVYYLEKDCHFSGAAVWNEDHREEYSCIVQNILDANAEDDS